MEQDYTEFEERLYRLAWDILWQDGVRAFTVGDLARQLGASKKTVYQVVTSKESLIENCIRYRLVVLNQDLAAVVATATGPVQKFIKISEYVSAFLSRIQVRHSYELKLRYPKIWGIIEDFRTRRKEQLLTLLQEAQQQGLVHPSLDTEMVVTLVIQIINAVFQPEFYVSNNLTIDATMRVFFKVFTEGIFTAEGLKNVEAV